MSGKFPQSILDIAMAKFNGGETVIVSHRRLPVFEQLVEDGKCIRKFNVLPAWDSLAFEVAYAFGAFKIVAGRLDQSACELR